MNWADTFPTKEFMVGEKGRSVFYQPLLDLSLSDRWNIRVPKFMQRMKDSKDDRSLVIIAALAIENQIEQLLELFMLGYESEGEFGTKVNKLKQLKLVPPHIISSIDTIRKVRNAFAHDISIETIEMLDQGLLDSIKTSYRYLKKSDAAKITEREKFWRLSVSLIHTLQYYEPVMITFNEFLTSDEFQTIMEQRTRARSRASVK